jgi:chromosome segregation ATPase
METLRAQVRETSERLHKAEIDNDELRERMALRHRELEELRHTIATSTPSEAEMAELRLRLETAENAAAALSRELDRVEAELEQTRSRFHMAMLTEALREFDNDEIEIEHEDPLDHTVVIRNGSSLTPTTRR